MGFPLDNTHSGGAGVISLEGRIRFRGLRIAGKHVPFDLLQVNCVHQEGNTASPSVSVGHCWPVSVNHRTTNTIWVVVKIMVPFFGGGTLNTRCRI